MVKQAPTTLSPCRSASSRKTLRVEARGCRDRRRSDRRRAARSRDRPAASTMPASRGLVAKHQNAHLTAWVDGVQAADRGGEPVHSSSDDEVGTERYTRSFLRRPPHGTRAVERTRGPSQRLGRRRCVPRGQQSLGRQALGAPPPSTSPVMKVSPRRRIHVLLLSVFCSTPEEVDRLAVVRRGGVFQRDDRHPKAVDGNIDRRSSPLAIPPGCRDVATRFENFCSASQQNTRSTLCSTCRV